MLPILDIEKGSHISIIRDGVVPDAGSLTQSLTRAFHEAGWVVENPVVIGVGNPPITGIAVRVPDSSNMTGAQRAVCAAFNTAKIPYDLQSGMHQVDEHMIVANILVSQPSG